MMNLYTGRLDAFLKTIAVSLLMVCSCVLNKAQAQRVYANQVTIGTAANDHVTNPTNAISSSNTTFAQLNSYGGIAVGLGAYSGQLELKFPGTVPAGVTTYVRINSNPDLLKSLLGGSLGGLLANVLGTVVLGNHYFNVQARNGSTPVLSGSSTAPFSGDSLRLVVDANGYYYLALTPRLAYDRVYIQDVTNAVLLGVNNNTQVYYAFYNSTASSDPCAQGFATSFDGTGLTLDLLNTGNAGVTNPQNAIDTDTSNYSQLGLGALAVAGSVSQDIYFENLSKADDEFHIITQSSPALLNVGLANNIVVTTYNGTTVVSTQSLSSLLGADLLGLLNTGQKTTVVVRPGEAVSRVRVTFNSLLNANLTQAIRLFGVIRTAGRPAFTGTQSQNYTICTGGTVGLGATTSTGNEIRWYADSTTTTPLLTTSSGALYTTPALNTTTKYYVAAAKIGCTYESERVPVTVTVKAIPTNPVVPAVQPICSGKTATFSVSNAEAGVTYRWYTAATAGALLDSGVSFVTPVLTDSTTFYVEGSNGTCTNTGGRTAVLVPVSKLPVNAAPVPLTREICSGSTTTFTVQNAQTGVTYNWYDAPTAGNIVFTGVTFVTPQLAANTSYYVEGVNATGCASSVRSQVTVIVNPAPATPMLVTPIVNMNPGGSATFAVANPIDSLTYNWYDASTGGTLVHTGTSYTTGPINASTNYYVEAVNSKGCVSPARATATINVQTDVVCGYGTSQQTVSQSICLLCGITDANNSVDADLNNYATINTTVGIGGFGQLLKFSNTGYPGDSISLILEVPGQTLGATLLGGIALQTYSGNNPNGDLIFLDSTVAKLQLLGTGGSPKFKITVPARNSFDGVAVTVSGVTALGQLRVYSAQTYAATPLLTSESVMVHASAQVSPVTTGTLCVGCTVTDPLLAVDADTTTHSTVNATIGLLSGVGQLLQFPGSFNDGDSIQLDLEVPSQALGLQLLSGIQVETYTNGIANGSPIAANSSLAQVQLLGLGGNGKFRLKIAANHSFNGVVVRINDLASVISNLYVYDAAVFYSSQNVVNVCKGSSAVLTVKSPLNATINWYTTPAGGTPVFTGTSYTTPPLTTNATYYIESSRNGCVNGNRTIVNVVANDIPANPTLNTNAVSICQGDSATLYATAPAGRLFKWYTASSGGTAIFTGDTLVTPALNATTTYYAESLNNGCPSTGRTAAVVTVNTPPADVAVTPPSATIGSGQTASFTASSSTSGVTFNWYAAATGGTPIFTGPAFVTPALTASTSYYLGADAASSCGIATRLVVPVTVITGSGVPVPCDAATTQTTAVNGLCIGCSVDSASLAIDNDATTASSLHVIAGLANASVQQTLGFPFTGDAGDTIAISVTFPVGVTDVGLLSSLQVATYNGSTFNNDRTALGNNSPVQLSLLSGSRNAILKYAPTQAFDRVELRVNSGLATLLNAVNVNYAQRIKPSPSATSDTVVICQNQQATLTATGPANTTFKWYSQATGGTPLFIGASYQTPVLTDTAIYYAESVSNTGCAAQLRSAVVVNVIPSPAAPAVTDTTVTICSGTTATLSVRNPQAGITYSWYATTSGGTAIATGTTYTTSALTRDTIYYVGASSTVGGCTSASRTAVNVVVNAALPAPVVASSNIAACANSVAILSIQNPQGGLIYNWYNTATGGTILGTGASFTTPAVTANAIYYAEAVSSGNCVSPRTPVNVAVTQPPVAPSVAVNPANSTITAGQTATLTATSATPAVTYNWYLQATGGTPIFTGAVYTTPALTSTTTYYVEAVLSSGAGCASTRTAATITVTPGINLACDAATAETNSANGVCIGCGVGTSGGAVDTDTSTFSSFNIAVGLLGAYVEQTLGFPSVSTPGDTVAILMEGPSSLLAADLLGAIQVQSYNGVASNNDPLLLNNGLVKVQLLGQGAGGKFLVKFVPGAPFDRVQVRVNSGVVSALNTLNVYYATRQVAPPTVAATSVPICSGTTASLTATASPNATIEWFTVPVGGAAVGSGNTYTTPVLTATTVYYAQAKRTSTNCPNANRVQVTVLVNPRPAVPATAADTVRVCAGNTAVLSVATPQSGVTYNWYTATGTLAGSGAALTTPVLSASTFYGLEAVNTVSGCSSSSRDTVRIIVSPIPAPRGIIGTNDSTVICAGSATLRILNPETGVTYNWYNVSTGGSIVFTGTVFQTPVLTANNTYYIEAVSAAGCSSGARTAATVVVNPVLPPPAVVSNNVSICSGSQASFQIQNPQAGGVYRWYNGATGGTALFEGATYVTPPLTANATYYIEAISAAGCAGSSRTAVTVTVNSQPTIPVLANNNVVVCAGNAATLAIQNPQSGITYRWYDSAVAGNLVFTGTTFVTPALSAGVTYYVEAGTGAGCSSSARAIATVTVNTNPSAPVVAGGNTSICSGNSVTLSVQNAQTGVTYIWYDTSGTLVFSGANYITPALTSTTTYSVEARSAAGCTGSARTTVTVNVNSTPSIPVVAGASGPVCAGSSTVLTIQNPQSGVTYNWYDAVTGGTLLFSGTSITTPALTATVSYYVAALNGNCASTNRTQVTVTVSPRPADPVMATTGTSVCTGQSTTLTVSNAQAGLTYTWYNAGSGGTLLTTGSSYTTPVLTASTTYYVEVSNGTCTGNMRTRVDVTVAQTPVAPIVAGTSICAGSTATLQVQSPQTGITYRWYNTATGGNLLTTGTSYTTPQLSDTTTYYVEAVGAGGCTASVRTAVTVTVNPQPAIPILASNAVTICADSTVTLSVQNPQGGIIYRWYDSARGGNLLFTGVNFTTPVLAASTTYYVEAAGVAGCVSTSRTVANITVNPRPAVPVVAGGNASICAGTTTTLNIQSPQAGVTYNWYNAGGTLVFTGPSYTTPQLNAATTYSVEARSAAGCTGSVRTSVTVNVNTVPTSPVIAGAGTICAGSTATLTVQNPQSGVTYNWYNTGTGGTILFTGTSYTTPVLTADSTYYIAALNGGCSSSSRTQVTVSVAPRPANAVVAATGTTACIGQPTTLSVSDAQAGLTYTWYTAASGGTLLATGSTYTTGPLTANVSYYVEVSNGTCTGSARTKVDVTVVAAPSAPVVAASGRTICSGDQAVLTIQNQDPAYIYNWYDLPSGGNLLFTGSVYTTNVLTSNTTFYVASALVSGCSSTSRTTVSVTVNPVPAVPAVVSTNITICSGSMATLQVQNPVPGVTYNWYDAAAGGIILSTGNSYTTAALTANGIYYVEASNGSCSSNGRTQVNVSVTTPPASPVISASGTTVCIGQATTLTVDNAQIGLTYTWYSAASGGTLLATGSSYTTQAITTNASYYVEVSNGNCTSTTRTRVDVTVVATPSAPVVAPSAAICSGAQATLTIQNPDPAYVYNWYDQVSGGNLLFTGNSYTTNALTGNTTFYVAAAVNTGCSSTTRTAATVTVNPIPAVPSVVTNNVSVCTGAAATLQVQNPLAGVTYNWYNVATGGTVLSSGTSYTINNVTTAGVYYVEAVNGSGCASASRQTVNVNITATPVAPSVANTTPSVCSGSMVTLTASSAVTGAVYNWYSSATGTSVIFTGNSFVTGAITSDTTFYVAVANAGGCTSSGRGQTTVTLIRPLAAPVVTVDSTTAQSVTFKWDAVNGATGYEVTLDGGNTFAVPNGSNGRSHTIGGLQPNQTISIEVRALGAQSCQTSPLSAKVTGTAVNPLGNTVFIPNVFTPNNDGKNDFFTAYGNNIASLEMWIFSQWGDLLYRSSEKRGWNGMSGDKLQPVGVYVYIMKVKLLDGTVVDRKGSVNLVR